MSNSRALKKSRRSASTVAGVLVALIMLLTGCSHSPTTGSDVLGRHLRTTWSDQLKPGYPSIAFTAVPTSDGKYSGSAVATFQDGSHATLLRYQNQDLLSGANHVTATVRDKALGVVAVLSDDGKTLNIQNCLRYFLVPVSTMTCTFEMVK